MTENDITAIILGSAIEVHRCLGPGLLESVYQQCLFIELSERGLYVEKEKRLGIIYKDIPLDSYYRMDLLVEGTVLVELKSVEFLTGLHFAQTLTYLRLSKMRLGLLINFNVPVLKDGIKRVINGY